MKSHWCCGVCCVVVLIVCQFGFPLVARAQESNANAILFDRYEGTLVEFDSATVTISTLDGEKTLSWAKAPRSSRSSSSRRVTAVSIQGIERSEFLRPGMMVHFIGELDREGKPTGEVLAIQVTALRADDTSTKDPLGAADTVTGVGRYRISGNVHSLDAKTNQFTVELPNGRKSERMTFRLNPEKTQVVYNLPESSIAKAGDMITIRCLPPEAGDSLATEIRVVRTNALTGELTDEQAIVRATGLARGYPVDDEIPLARDQATQNQGELVAKEGEAMDESGEADENGGGGDGGGGEVGDPKPQDMSEDPDAEIEVFDFPEGDAQTQQAFERRLGEMLPDRNIGGEPQAEPWRPGHTLREFKPKPNPDRRWFKIH